jgi:Cdc6-like AAA superfamily ATPase
VHSKQKKINHCNYYKLDFDLVICSQIQKIVEGGIPGVPYIIFGPPGTGKTVTLVEAIKQVRISNKFYFDYLINSIEL